MKNILVIGTPGTGKTTLCKEIASICKIAHINLSEDVKSLKMYTEYDEEYNSYVIDENKMKIKQGPILLDYHGCDFVNQHWFSRIFVLRTDIKILAERLEKRFGVILIRLYSQFKIQENIDSEIFQIILDEAIEHFGKENVEQLNSNDFNDYKNNLNKIIEYINA